MFKLNLKCLHHNFVGFNEIVELLVQNGAEINVKNADFDTPLTLVAAAGTLKHLKQLNHIEKIDFVLLRIGPNHRAIDIQWSKYQRS